MLVKKNSFLVPNLIKKPTKNQNHHPNIFFGVIFSYKNLRYWFWRKYCEISAHTDVPNLFSILNCLFAMNLNPVVTSCYPVVITVFLGCPVVITVSLGYPVVKTNSSCFPEVTNVFQVSPLVTNVSPTGSGVGSFDWMLKA